MAFQVSRRAFLKDLGLGPAVLPFLLNLPSLGLADAGTRKQRLIIVFSPNGVVPPAFWPDEVGGDFRLKRSLEPLEPYRSRTMILNGVADKVRGDGDNHMRGIGCLLTGIELFPGNIQGGSHTPAGWSTGHSIDQEVKNYLQSQPETRTRFGSIEFGVMVPERADTWTRMVYSGPNKPIAPIDDPYQMFSRLYGQVKDRESLQSILDDLQEDLRKVERVVGVADRHLIEEHANFVREMEQDLKASATADLGHPVPELEPGLKHDNDQMPKLTKTQIDLLVQSMVADFTRVSTFQFTNSVGQAKMRWLGVDQGHHELSHEPDTNEEAQEKLININRWFCEQLAYLARKLDETPEPGGEGSMLDHTLIVWTNELGKGNSHTLDDIPFVLVGGAPGFKMGQALKFPQVPHNRLLLSLAHAMGHPIERFGNPDYCGDGPLSLG